jgi:hypothetical protein
VVSVIRREEEDWTAIPPTMPQACTEPATPHLRQPRTHACLSLPRPRPGSRWPWLRSTVDNSVSGLCNENETMVERRNLFNPTGLKSKLPLWLYSSLQDL